MIVRDAYILGDRAPARVEEPGDAERVADVLGAAAEAGAAIVAFGGSTLQSVGNSPTRYTTALSLRRLDRVLAYDSRDLTIGLEAGIPLASVARVLEAASQFIPFDAPHPHRATVGGTLASGWAGPRRAAYGHTRDLLIGSTVALTDGSLASAGGMVVKNVTGYDMSKLYVGSLGTLAVIVRANFKTLPRPAVARIAVAPLTDGLRERTLNALGQLAIEPTATLLVDGFFGRVVRLRDEESRLFVLFEGSAAVIERATRDLRSVLGKCGVAETLIFDGDAAQKTLQSVIDAYIEPLEDRSITYRSAGLPSNVWPHITAAAERVRGSAATCDFIADLRTGDAILRIASATHQAMHDVLPRIDAVLRDALPAATVLAGDARLRARVDAWGAPPSTIATQRAIKIRFDPHAILAPGRYVGGL